MSTNFKIDLKLAVEDGILIGVKWGVAIALIGAILLGTQLWVYRDYMQTKEMAAHGEQVYQFALQQQKAAAEAAAKK